jgi:hypothetical protein
MEAPSPARLFAAAAGAVLVVLGILGFFYNASFGALDSYEEAFAGLRVNGWLNLFLIATGSVGVLVAGASSRTYALAIGFLYALLAIVGWGSGWLFVTVAVLGIAAALGTPKLKARAKPARQRA